MRPIRKSGLLPALLLLASAAVSPPRARADEAELTRLAEDAYIYGYPIMLMDLTARTATNVAMPDGHRAPINQLARVTELPDPQFTAVVMPNVDTLYTSAFLDLSAEPIVLHVPDTHGRYELMPLLDAYSNVFASPGTRTTGKKAIDVAIVAPGYKGKLPHGVSRIAAPTKLVWLLGRTQINGRRDLPEVAALTAQYTLTPLSAYGQAYTPPLDPNIDQALDMETPPPKLVAGMSGKAYFTRLAILLREYPPPARDRATLARFEKLGLAPGSFAPSPQAMEAIEDVGARATQRMQDRFAELGQDVNGWHVDTALGSYDTRYLDRAAVAQAAFGANLAKDAVYPAAQADAQGAALDGEHRYLVHFPAGQAPPVNAFWSLTLYDARGYLVENPIKRYAIGSRDDLIHNPDGSFDLFIQHEQPQGAREANWLPAPEGKFQVVMRLYWPKDRVLNGAWQPPPIRRVHDVADQPRPRL